jgi:hypothetical protein
VNGISTLPLSNKKKRKKNDMQLAVYKMTIASTASPIYDFKVPKRYIWLQMTVARPRQESRVLWLA